MLENTIQSSTNTGNTQLRPDQLAELFSELSYRRTELRHLILRDVDISTLNHVKLHDGLRSILTLNLQVEFLSLSLSSLS